MLVVLGQMIDHTGAPGVQLPAAEVLRRDDLTDGGLDERRPAEEDRALVPHDHGLVTHRGNIRAAGGAGSEDCRQLRDALGTHPRLVEEDAAEMLTVGEDLILLRQERPAGVDEVEAGKPVLERDLLRTKMLLHGERQVASALDRRVIADDHHVSSVHEADAGDHARPRHLSPVHPVRGERRHLEKRAAFIEQSRDPLPRQQLAASDVSGARGLGAAERGGGAALAQLGCEHLLGDGHPGVLLDSRWR